MKKNTFYFLKLVLASTFLALNLLSCKSPSVENVTPKKQEPFEIVDGKLKFVDMNSWKSYMTRLHEDYTPTSLVEWNSKQDGFTSLYKIQYDEQAAIEYNKSARVASGNDSTYRELVEDVYFASLLNTDGEMMLGEKVVRVTMDYVFIYPKNNKRFVDSFDSGSWRGQLESQKGFVDVGNGILVGKIRRHIHQSQSGGRVASLPIDQDHDLHYFNDTDRFVTEAWNNSYLIYASMGTKVQHENKKWYGWVTSWTTSLKLLSSVTLPSPIIYGATYAANFQDGPYDHIDVIQRAQWQTGTLGDQGYVLADPIGIEKLEAWGTCYAGYMSYTGYAVIGN
jgi:hypothetical protein